MNRRHLVAALILCATAGGEAFADPGAAAPRGGVVVYGKASSNDQATVASAVRSAARSGGWDLPETPLSDADAQAIATCLAASGRWACIARIPAARSIERLIAVRIDSDGAHALSLSEQILVAGSDVPTSDQQVCRPCADAALTKVAFELTKSLLDSAAVGTTHTTLTVRSWPPGAWVTIDAASVGPSNRTFPTFPGLHHVSVHLDGHPTQERDVVIPVNQDTVLEFRWDARPPPSHPPPALAAHPYLPAAIVGGVGVIALGAGIVVQSTDGGPPLGQDQRPRIYSAPGIGLVVGGGLATIAGVYLWTRTHRRTHVASAPVAAFSDGGGLIGWMGTF